MRKVVHTDQRGAPRISSQTKLPRKTATYAIAIQPWPLMKSISVMQRIPRGVMGEKDRPALSSHEIAVR